MKKGLIILTCLLCPPLGAIMVTTELKKKEDEKDKLIIDHLSTLETLRADILIMGDDEGIRQADSIIITNEIDKLKKKIK